MKNRICLLVGFLLLTFSGLAYSDDDDDSDSDRDGLNRDAMKELVQAGVNKYLGEFSPTASQDHGNGWTKHTFDPEGGAGPICIAGTPYSVFTKEKDPKNLLVFMQGGGACWQDFYFCNILSEDQEPPKVPGELAGIFDESIPTNPFADYSIAYLPYCDGSVFSGDNDVLDGKFPFGPVRFHRGMRNASAGMDVARAMFPKARNIVVAGSSAGGVGAAGFAPFLARMAFGNRGNLSVFNDAGPVAVNEQDVTGIAARTTDWQFQQFYPASCTDCVSSPQGTEIIRWRLDNDRSIRESFYSTDGDRTNRFFLNVPFHEVYRDLIVSEHGKLNAAHPDRYKRFIRSGDDFHTALQFPFFYLFSANGVLLSEWVADFLKPGKCARRDDDDDSDSDSDSDDNRQHSGCTWVDIVEDFAPLPPPPPPP